MQAVLTAPTLERQRTHALLTTVISVILGLALSVLIARTLGPTGKGLLDVAGATAGLFTLVLGASLNSALTHHIARLRQTPAGLAGQLALWGGIAGGITVISLGAWPQAAVRLGLLAETDRRFWIGFVAATVAFGVWAAGLRGILLGRNALIAVNRIDLAIKATLLAAYGVLAWGAIARPQIFAVVGVGAAAALSLALLIALRGPTVPATGTWTALLAIAVPVHGTNILHFINQRADIFFVQAFHGAREVGLYALAVSLAQIVLLLSSAVAQPLLAQVSGASSSTEAAEAAARLCRFYVVLGLIASGLLALTAPWLVSLVFGRAFNGSLPSLLTLLVGMIAFGLTNILISYFVGVGRSRINLWISLATLSITVAGNTWLTRRYGALGAAITSTVAYGIAGGISVWVFARHTGMPARRVVLPGRADWRAAMLLVGQFRL